MRRKMASRCVADMAAQSFHASWLARIASSTTSGVAVW